MNNGKERSALTAAEFRDYLKEARQAIDLRKAPGT